MQEYHQLYPTGSNPGRFYDTAKLYKLTTNTITEEIPVRSVVFNIDTVSYRLAKDLGYSLSL